MSWNDDEPAIVPVPIRDGVGIVAQRLWAARDTDEDDVLNSAISSLPYREYLMTGHWQRVRQRKLAIAGYQCRRCRTTDERLDVHHLTYDRLGREADSDLEVLCALCHAKEHAA